MAGRLDACEVPTLAERPMLPAGLSLNVNTRTRSGGMKRDK